MFRLNSLVIAAVDGTGTNLALRRPAYQSSNGGTLASYATGKLRTAQSLKIPGKVYNMQVNSSRVV